jgi:hypothetical protein
MAFTFPKDTNNKSGAVKEISTGNFVVPIVPYGSDGVSIASEIDTVDPTKGNIRVSLANSKIALPVEIQLSDKTLALQSTTALASNGFYISPTIDCGSANRISGYISTDQAGTFYIQQSDDQNTWYNASTISITASTSVTINSVAYYSSTTFNFTTTVRYVRIAYVNGSTAQTRFSISGYTGII